MSIKKKLGMGVLSATLGISLIGGGTFAYFSDTEETNNTFAAGTLDLNLKSTDDSEEVNVNIDNMKPGDWKVHQIRLYNDGSLNFKDVVMLPSYEVADAKGDNDGEDFADHLHVNIMDTATNTNIVSWTPLSEIDDAVLAEKLEAGDRQILRFDFKFIDNGEDQNKFQGDAIDLNLTFEASQEDGSLR
ncbi:TasA family protein [Piscibacillus halophilus]|uniref:TasA family protein n=1 Tax=Piscibacillus halophilus TaxID=571933 RepID=UPI00158A012D|nr:TasA family protein [Piscibacillus halophilus]